MTNNDIAWFAGLVVTLIPALVYFVLLITADYSPIERRARRFAVLASVIVSAAIWSATATVYSFVSQLIGSFLMFPSIGLTAVGIWYASRITYLEMGGGKELQDRPSQ